MIQIYLKVHLSYTTVEVTKMKARKQLILSGTLIVVLLATALGPLVLELPPWWIYLILLILVVVIIGIAYLYMRSSRSRRLIRDMYAGKREYPEKVRIEAAKKPASDARIARLEAALKTLKKQHDEGLLSDEVYNELKEKNEEQLRRLRGG